MEEIENTFNHNIAINQACAIRRMLNDEKFIFWLNVFHCLMPHVDILLISCKNGKLTLSR